MRIAYITDHAKPQIDGAALRAERTLQHLRASGHQVQRLRPWRRGESMLDSRDEWRCPESALTLHAGLRQRWRNDPPELVHVASTGPLAWAALRIARAHGIATTADFRGGSLFSHAGYRPGWLAPLQQMASRRLHAWADTTFVPTPALASRLGAEGYRGVQVLGRGVDSQAFSPAWRDAWLRRSWHADNRSPVLLFVGRLVAEQNLRLALQTHETLRRERPALRMVVVGDGPLRKHLEYAYPRVRFVGAQRATDLARHYASADVLLFPSLCSGFGDVVLEAMASGLAVVAFNAAAAALHVQHGSNGWLAPAGDTAAFVEAARLALLHAAPAAPVRQAARAAVAGLDWAAPLRALEQHMHDAGRRAGRPLLQAVAA